MDLTQAKILGGIGAILILCLIIPSIGWILSIAGFILTLISVYKISKVVNENSIFYNYLTSVILYFVSIITAITIFIVSILRFIIKNIENIKPDYWEGFDNFGWKDLPRIRNFLPLIKEQIWIFLLIVIAIWVILIIAGLFTNISFNRIAEKVKIENFKTSGLLIFIGSILTIILGIGFIIILIGVIFEIISFFSLPDRFEIQQNQQS